MEGFGGAGDVVASTWRCGGGARSRMAYEASVWPGASDLKVC
jgi:hypothetical protein